MWKNLKIILRSVWTKFIFNTNYGTFAHPDTVLVLLEYKNLEKSRIINQSTEYSLESIFFLFI